MPSSSFFSGRRARDRPSPESFIVFHPKPREEVISTGTSSSTRCGSGAGSRGRGRDGVDDRIISALLAANAEASSRRAEAERILVELSSKDSSSGARTTNAPKSREVISRGSSGSIHSGSGGARMTKGSYGSIHSGSGDGSRGRGLDGHDDRIMANLLAAKAEASSRRAEAERMLARLSRNDTSSIVRTTQTPKSREIISKCNSGSIHSGSGGARMMKIRNPREVNSKGDSGSIHSGSRDGIRRRGCDEDDDRIISALLIAKAEAASKKAKAERMLVGLMCRDKERALKRADVARAKRERVENVAHKCATPPPLRNSLQGFEDREQPEAYGRSLKPSVQRNVRFSKTDTQLTFDDNSENIGVRANQHTFVTTLAPAPSVASPIAESNSSRVSRLSSRPMPKIILGQSTKNIIEETSRFKSPALFPKVFGEHSTRRFDSNYSNESALFSVAIGERSSRLDCSDTNDQIVSFSDSLAGSTSDTCDDFGSVASNVLSSSTSEESELTGGHPDFWFFNFLGLNNMFNCASSVYQEPIDDLPTGDSFVTECTEHTNRTQHTELTEYTDRAVYPLCFI